MRILFYDVETTGVKYNVHAIHQISGMIVIDGKIKETFDFRVRPHKGARIDQGALDVGKLTEEQIMAYDPMEEVFPKFMKIIAKYVPHRFKKGNKQKLHLAGYNNASFDDKFLEALMYRNNEKYFYAIFHWPSIDVARMAAVHFLDERETLPGKFKLMDICKYLNIPVEEDKLHDSLYDIELTYEAFKTLYRVNGYTWDQMHDELEMDSVIKKQRNKINSLKQLEVNGQEKPR